MQKLIAFNHVTLDGYFADKNGDMRWAHKKDEEWNAFVAENAKGGGTLLFGRITYELMTSYWPTPLAAKPGEGMAILGSGSIVSQLAQEGLIDEYQIVVNPVVLGKGRTMFDGIKETLTLKLTRTRAFGNGNVLLCYQPMA